MEWRIAARGVSEFRDEVYEDVTFDPQRLS